MENIGRKQITKNIKGQRSVFPSGLNNSVTQIVELDDRDFFRQTHKLIFRKAKLKIYIFPEM